MENMTFSFTLEGWSFGSEALLKHFSNTTDIRISQQYYIDKEVFLVAYEMN